MKTRFRIVERRVWISPVERSTRCTSICLVNRFARYQRRMVRPGWTPIAGATWRTARTGRRPR
jgi:hypothetical protein